jgi:crotonobetainyl-CoA:carnitine CoA-transferase CaiB-like acyl-CoA transferase
MHAGAQAAVGSLIAHHYVKSEGRGQHVDISIQEAVVRQIYIETGLWEYTQSLYSRCGSKARRGTVVQKENWQCKDGWVSFRIMAGAYGKGIQTLVAWMDSEGMAGSLRDIDWSQVDIATLTQEESDVWEDIFSKFFLRHTIKEIYEESIKRRIYLLPTYTPKQIVEDVQLKARNYWVKVDHDELGEELTYPGPGVRFSETPMRIGPRAPLIGEHNQEIYECELGLSNKEITLLKETKII